MLWKQSCHAELTDDGNICLQKAASGSHGAHFEELAASKAASKGKLSAIMKPVAAKGDSMSAEKKAKGR